MDATSFAEAFESWALCVSFLLHFTSKLVAKTSL